MPPTTPNNAAAAEPPSPPAPSPPPYPAERYANAKKIADSYGITFRRAGAKVIPEIGGAVVLREEFADDVLAAEAAAAALDENRAKRAEVQSGRLILALQAGTYYARPEMSKVELAPGLREDAPQWWVQRASDGSRVAGPYPAVIAALAEIARRVQADSAGAAAIRGPMEP